jgi:hypothetical protein
MASPREEKRGNENWKKKKLFLKVHVLVRTKT